MTFYVENETKHTFSFDVEMAVKQVIEKIMEHVSCPYEVEVNVLLTDLNGIASYNEEFRGLNKPTDVLSFPNVDYEVPEDFSIVENDEMNYLNLDTNELILGDIIVCVDKVMEQAEAYGHGEYREFSFLIAHSMLHLLGYDHIIEEEEQVMFLKQENILEELDIKR